MTRLIAWLLGPCADQALTVDLRVMCGHCASTIQALTWGETPARHRDCGACRG